MFRLLLLFLLIIPFQDGKKSQPLDRPISLSGNYGELRDGRFHAGVDFRVGGVVGEKVYSIDSGYVKCVSVSPNGYGNAVFIAHPDGTTSIYGHLLEFAPELAKRVKEKQYSEQSFSVRVRFNPDEFPVGVHTFIGRVGNTGSSAAPHLHLEIRNTDDSKPLNPFSQGYFDVKDTYPPIINAVIFYGFDDSTGLLETPMLYSLSKKEKGRVLLLPERSYVAIDADDYQNGTIYRLSVERYCVLFDGDTLFRFKLGEYSWEEQNLFCTLIESQELRNSGRKMITTRIGPRYGFSEKVSASNGGIIVLKDSLEHKIKVEVSDLNGNCAVRQFVVKRGTPSNQESSNQDSTECAPFEGEFAPWYLPWIYMNEGFSFSIPPATFEYSLKINAMIDSTNVPCGALSDVLRIAATPRLPFLGGASIRIPVVLPDSLKSKAMIAAVSEDGALHPCGGRYIEGKVVAKSWGFGSFCVAIDTIPPTITPKGRWVFEIKDEFSGVGDCVATIDGEWVLAAFDEKKDCIKVIPDPARVQRGANHELLIVLKDRKGNTTKLKQTFKW